MQSKIISTNEALVTFCASVAQDEFLTIDTEFIRERTYYSQLCLIQVSGEHEFAAIDPMAEGLDLAPFTALLDNPHQLKVFHAGSQDLEIFALLNGRLPTPIYDTQIAAMVCGFGEQIGYESLVRELCGGAKLDKGSRFTDWSRRPLSDRQIAYALDDVIHLRTIYRTLSARIEREGRSAWIAEEMAHMGDINTYQVDVNLAWRRLKVKSRAPEYLNILRTVAAWREKRAMQRDLPRQRVIRDEVLVQLAALAPDSIEDLADLRGGLGSSISKESQQDLVDAILAAKIAPRESFPSAPVREPELTARQHSLVDVLRLLLSQACEEHHVAQKLVAGRDELNKLVMDALPADHPLLNGWRHDVFGKMAVDFLQGKVSLVAEKTKRGYGLTVRHS